MSRPPSIRRLRAKIVVLVRRRDHLLQKLEQHGYSATPSAAYDRSESTALDAAIRLMEHYAEECQ